MKIILPPEIMIPLTAWYLMSNGREFSGLGLVERNGEDLTIVQVDLLGVGSNGYTEFGGERQRLLPLDPRRKLWFHRHPIGDGKPGPHNWSGRDNQTAEREPFGVDPQLVQWSVSIVLTPGGWVGRVDFYVPKLRTFHVPVEPNLPTPEIIQAAQAMCTPELAETFQGLLAEYHAIRGQDVPVRRVPGNYSFQDFDWEEELELSGVFCNDCGVECAFESEGDVEGVADYQIVVCPNCQQFYLLLDAHSATLVVPELPEPPAWEQTKFWKQKR